MADNGTVKMLITAWFSGDEAARQEYLPASDKIFKAHGMTNATLYQADTALAGDLMPHAVVMLEWEDAARCKAAFDSPEYKAILDARDRAFERLDITLLA